MYKIPAVMLCFVRLLHGSRRDLRNGAEGR
jgi:hypothetical protein